MITGLVWRGQAGGCFASGMPVAKLSSAWPHAPGGQQKSWTVSLEVSSATHGLRAQTLICCILARLATSDRESPVGLTRSGTQQARRAVAACLSRLTGAR